MENAPRWSDLKQQPLRPWQLARHWGWVLVLGAVLVILGVVGIWMSFTMILRSVLAAGWFLLVAGLLQILHTFSRHPHRNFGLDLMIAVSYVILGALIVSNPAAGARESALLLSLFFMVTGIYRIITAASEPIAARSAVLVAGLVSLFLGIHLWVIWTSAGLWLISFYIGVEIAVNGWSLIMRGLAEKHL